MNNIMIEEKVKELEYRMWEAFACGDASSFRTLVSEDAMMICGGLRESGLTYAQIVEQVKLDRYSIRDFVVKRVTSDTVLTNYIVVVECPDTDISGTFRVSSLWVQNDNEWRLLFNQDTKLYGENI